MRLSSTSSNRRFEKAFTLVEVLVATGLAAIILMALYLGITGSFGLMGATRENLRATQIMVEKLEAIRLYTWTQLTNPAYLERTFTDYYYPNTNRTDSLGSVYSGQVIITNVPFGLTYSTNMRMVTVRVSWTNGTIQRVRDMSTFVSKQGLQRYVIQ